MSIRFNTRKNAARRSSKGPIGAHVAATISYLPERTVKGALAAQRAAKREHEKEKTAKAEAKSAAKAKKTKRQPKKVNPQPEASADQKLIESLNATNKLVADLAKQVATLSQPPSVEAVLEQHQKGKTALNS